GEAQVLEDLRAQAFFGQKLIVRSSSSHEDSNTSSMAGAFESVLGAKSLEDARDAIVQVINSYESPVDDDMVFIQPLLENTKASGVAFTYDPNNGAPYFVVDFIEGDDTTATTAGSSNEGKTCYVHHSNAEVSDALVA